MTNFVLFKGLASKLNEKIDENVWQLRVTNTFVNIYKVNFDGCPQLTMCIKINSDLAVEIWHQNTPLHKVNFVG